MQHLDPERLAALDEIEPSTVELAHLAACDACRSERLAFARLAELSLAELTLAEYSDSGLASAQYAPGRDRLAARPLTNWHSLAAALRDEQLLVEPAHAPRRVVRRGWHVPAFGIAAALTLLIGGVALGRVSMTPTASAQVAANRVASAIVASSAVDGFASVQEASAALALAEREYQRASFWLAANDTTVNAQAVYRARLAALDQMMSASRAGLFEAPQDPVLNQYYLAAYAAREATLQQLGRALPVNRVMERF